MSSSEIVEWMTIYNMEPWGEERADLRSAMICKTLADINTPKDKPRAKIEDFMPKYGRQEEDPEAVLQKVSTLNALLGGRDLRDVEDDD